MSIQFYSKVNNEIILKGLTDKIAKDQLRRASLSVSLNIAEGTSRTSKADRKHFYTIARGSAYECVAMFDILKNDKVIDDPMHLNYCTVAEQIVRMLYAMEKLLSELKHFLLLDVLINCTTSV